MNAVIRESAAGEGQQVIDWLCGHTSLLSLLNLEKHVDNLGAIRCVVWPVVR